MAPGKHILIIDDDEPFRQAFVEQLQLHEELIPIEAATGAGRPWQSDRTRRRPSVACAPPEGSPLRLTPHGEEGRWP